MATRDVVQAAEVRLARVESMRAIAALAVLIGHLWLFGHAADPEHLLDTFWHRLLFSGGFGVFVFFALSGYLLFWPFARHYWGGEPERPNLRIYARNRALRILPLYWFAVVVLLLVQNEGGTFELWWRHLLFVQSMWRDSLTAVDGSLWSVAVELQFYAQLPLLAAGLALATRRSALGAAVVLVAAAVGCALLRRHLAGHNGDLWGYQLPTTFQYFVPGMLVALLRLRWDRRAPSLLAGPAGSSTVWLAASLPLWWLVVDRFNQELILPACFLLVGALVLPLRRGAGVAALEWRPLVAVGVASYSLYVWHLPIIDALDIDRFAGLALAGLPLSLAVAFLSYRLVERPPLLLRRQWARGSAAQLGSRS
jgi:peptidoglycan/LPS O-acetylase OafA/YrhL